MDPLLSRGRCRPSQMPFLREHVVQRQKKTTKNHAVTRRNVFTHFKTFTMRRGEKKQAQNALFLAFCSVCVCVKAFPVNGITHCSNIPECNNLFILISPFSHCVQCGRPPISKAHCFSPYILSMYFPYFYFSCLISPPSTPPFLPPFSYHQISDYTKGLKPGHAAAPFHLSYCCLDLEIKGHSNLVFDKGFLHPFFCIGLCCIRQLSCSDILE